MKRLHYFLTLAGFLLCNVAYAQVGINTRTPDPSAALDVTGIGKGILIPRMTLAQRPNSPVSGLLIYQTDNQPGFYYFDGIKWQLLNGSGFNDTLTQNLYTNGFWLSGDGQNDGIYLQGNGTMLDTGTFNAGPNITVTGPGTRMLWYPKRSALRAGTAIGNEWDDNNIGNYSAAMGYGSNASGTYATAVGDRNTASGVASMASGSVNIASGNNSFVSGSNDTASGANTVAMGSYMSTNNHKGSFAFGDNSTIIVTNNDADNQMKMRFAGGYKLFTDGNATNGMELTSGGLLKYMNNMAGAYDARTVVDKNYVDSLLDDAYIWKQNVNTNGHFLSGDGTNTGVYMLPNGIMVDSGTFNSGADLAISGAGTRMMWYPKKAALRAGTVDGPQWDNNNIGDYSSALGHNNTASGSSALAVGTANTAAGTNTIALGNSNLASGSNAIVMGQASTAAGDNSFAAGNNANADGKYTAAMGRNVSTNLKHGSFILGDSSATVTNNDTFNQMLMRFAGGYKLYTDPATGKGIQITPGGVINYFNNVSGSYDSLSLVNKSYVDSLVDDAYTWHKNVNTNGHFLSGDGSNTGVYMLPNGLMADTGSFGAGNNIPITGVGTRLIWYPKRAAFRAGGLTGANGNYWDDGNIGQYSAAIGQDNKVNGYAGMALGQNNVVSGQQNFAAGYQNTATGASSIAIGVYCSSSGTGSAAIGYQNSASANGATALGEFTAATALGAFASGNIVTASGKWSTAMGRNVNTNSKDGSFIFGDTASASLTNDAFNQMKMRFKGGFKLYDNASANQGLLMDDGSMIQTGTFGSGTDIAVSGSGTRMIWYDKKGAFRAGVVSAAQWDNAAIGNYSTAFGNNTVATGQYAIAMGQNDSATSNNAVALGFANIANGQNSFTAGATNKANANYSSVLGQNSYANGTYAVAVGQNDTATGSASVAMGYFNKATQFGAVAMGLSNTASGQNSFAAGQNDTASAGAATALGSGNAATGANSFVAGGGNRASANYATALGKNSQASGFASIAIGEIDTATTNNAVALGWNNKSSGQNSFSVGGGNKASANYAVAMGQTSTATASNAIAIGLNAYATAQTAIAIGQSDTATASSAVALGWNNKARGQNTFTAGGNNIANGNFSSAFGNGSYTGGIVAFAAGQGDSANALNSVAMGYANRALGSASFAGGSTNITVGDFSTAFGVNSYAGAVNTFAAGQNDTAAGASAVALGYYAAAVGDVSFAVGSSNRATGQASVVMGQNNKSSGRASFVGGELCNATGDDAIAIGYNSTATNWGAVALGLTSLASGQNSFAVGQWDTASGNAAVALCSGNVSSGINSLTAGTANRATNYYTVAFGRSALASGYTATADGYADTASGDYSVAFGTRVSTNSHSGSFIFGDARTVFNSTRNDADNQMMMRFVGGYKLYTDTLSTVGVQVAAGGNSWATISDVRKKENFVPVNGEELLNKISKFKLTSWNYKGQDPKLYRHYGPMAQDFYAAFGKDKLGIVGNDTTVGQADMEGISFTAIQALEKRTQQLQQDNDKATAEISTLKKENDELQARMAKMEKEFEDRMQQVETAVIKQKSKNKVAVK